MEGTAGDVWPGEGGRSSWPGRYLNCGQSAGQQETPWPASERGTAGTCRGWDGGLGDILYYKYAQF